MVVERESTKTLCEESWSVANVLECEKIIEYEIDAFLSDLEDNANDDGDASFVLQKDEC